MASDSGCFGYFKDEWGFTVVSTTSTVIILILLTPTKILVSCNCKLTFYVPEVLGPKPRILSDCRCASLPLITGFMVL